MDLRIVKNQEDYEGVLAEIDTLIDFDPQPESREGQRLEILSLLAESFEEKVREELPLDPIEAILFRMEQQELTQSDLVPFIGSRAKVSEVLARKRPLSLSMIRALHLGLGIPAESLLLESDVQDTEDGKDIEIEWEKFPVKEMVRRGLISAGLTEVKANLGKYMTEFFSIVGGPQAVVALYRRSERSGRPMDKYALAVWTTQVLRLARANPPSTAFIPGTVTLELMKDLVKLSESNSGPLKAVEYLRGLGISLVIMPSLPKTYLDGAAIMSNPENPVIGLSLRYDRIDNFWFCLMHELAHISLHFDVNNQFYDDLDVKQSDDPREIEADAWAGEALIPNEVWQNSPVSIARSKESIHRLAKEMGIHPAIIAGRLRRQLNSYHKFNDLIGHGQVRQLFS